MSEIGNLVISWIMCGITFGSIIMYGALGEILTEKSGNMNLGTPGIMCIGGAFGFGGAYLYEINTETPNAVVTIIFALVCAFLSSALAGALFCFLTTTLRANQNVTGLALTILEAAFANRIFSAAIATESPVLKIFLGHGFMMYLALVVAIAMGYFLKRTRMGLNLRAVGENPATADAAGINVSRFKYAATILGAGISGLGGVYYVLDYNYGGWSTAAAGDLESLGWLAVALVIFAVWRPLNLIWGSYLFGLCYWLYSFISVFGVKTNAAQSSLLEMIPYVVTIVVLIVSSIRKKKENLPPASLGLSYFREER